ncbi:HAD family hydrolase [Oceanivirga miroungae]|uniref:phosphoserine phosphatase n=1 Tax=Oceanivirga miroungae TaxID=1130046 RepID=A0A6I8M6V9_9FUSO|nr:HAD-IB family hydrolase [Oceanivirga miroungae]VWL85217.1 phosphatase [Oceanivirga miroungae]
MANIAAFFDIDGTIFRNSLLIEHFKMLITYKFIKYEAFSGSVEEKFNKWAKREGDYDDYLEPLTKHYVNGLMELDEADVNYVAQRVIDLKWENQYRYAKKMLKFHKDRNDKIVIISGSPDFLVSKMAEKLGIEYFYASEYVVENNKYTGEVIPMWDSKSKQEAIKNFCEKYDIDLSNSYAYGDTKGDYSMFKLVGHPIALNPAKNLIDKIVEDKDLMEKIQIKVERKNVIYTLKASELEYNKGED